MHNKTHKILLIIKIPPPLTGVTTINKYISNSKVLNDNFTIQIIPITYKKKINNSKITLNKLIKIVLVFSKIIYNILRFKPNLIYFQITPIGTGFYRDFMYVLLLRLFNKKIIFHLHGKGIKEYVSNSSIKRAIYRYTFKNNYVICLSGLLTYDIQDVYDSTPYILNNGISKNITIYNINDTPKNKTFTILFLSNILISKGILTFINAIEVFHKKYNENYIAYIIGHAEDLYEKDLNLILAEKHLTNTVKYLGPRYDMEKTDFIANSDVLVYPTLNDAFPLVILEAMQLGKCVIASREGAIPDIIDDSISGFIVDKNNPDQISDKLLTLSNNIWLRKKMEKASLTKFNDNFSIEIFEKNLLSIFEDILKCNHQHTNYDCNF